MAEKYEILRATNYNIRAQISDYLKSLDARLKEVEGGGGGINGQYLWSTLTTGDPTAGHIATNNADYASATEVRVHKLSNAGNDLTVIIQPLKIGSLLGIFEVNAPAATALYRTTAIPVLTGDYFTISVSAEPFTGQSLPTVQDSDLNVTFTASTDVGDYMIYTYTDVDYTVQYHNECVFVDSTNPVTITLPASPEKDDYAGVWDAGNSAALNNITILRNGNTIADRDEDAVIDMNGGRFDLCYDDANTWKLAHVLGCIPYASTPINPQQSRALGWWELEEPETGVFQTVRDEVAAYEMDSGNPYVSVQGLRGQGAEMSGGSGYLQTVSAPDSFTLVDQVYSVSFWHKTPATLVGDVYIASQWRDANVPQAVEGRRKWRVIYNAAANGFTYSIGVGVGATYTGNIEVHTGDMSVTPDTWYHFAITHDPVANEMTLTVSKRGDVVGTRLSETVEGGAFDFGGTYTNMATNVARDSAGAKDCNGTIDMIAFWDTSAILSEADVQALFENEAIYSELSI